MHLLLNFVLVLTGLGVCQDDTELGPLLFSEPIGTQFASPYKSKSTKWSEKVRGLVGQGYRESTLQAAIQTSPFCERMSCWGGHQLDNVNYICSKCQSFPELILDDIKPTLAEMAGLGEASIIFQVVPGAFGAQNGSLVVERNAVKEAALRRLKDCKWTANGQLSPGGRSPISSTKIHHFLITRFDSAPKASVALKPSVVDIRLGKSFGEPELAANEGEIWPAFRYDRSNAGRLAGNMILVFSNTVEIERQQSLAPLGSGAILEVFLPPAGGSLDASASRRLYSLIDVMPETSDYETYKEMLANQMAQHAVWISMCEAAPPFADENRMKDMEEVQNIIDLVKSHAEEAFKRGESAKFARWLADIRSHIELQLELFPSFEAQILRLHEEKDPNGFSGFSQECKVSSMRFLDSFLEALLAVTSTR